ncbi:MAG: efflux RND transporter permease subunit [Opitutaceae bacterium]
MPPTPTGQAFQLTANVPAALSDAREFGEIILKAGSDADGTLTRIKDVGRVELGARSYSQVFKVDGRPAGGIAIYQLPGANALATASGVRELLGRLKPGFPEDLAYGIPFDTTTFVRQSVHEVYQTLFWRPDSWCCSSSWCFCRTLGRPWCRRRPFRSPSSAPSPRWR